MDWLELIKYLAGLLPPGVLGAVIVVIAGLYIHRSKRFPWKVVRSGVNGSTTVTANMLKANCNEFHLPLNTTIEAQTKSLDTLVTKQEKIQDQVGEIAETVSFIKGQLSK